MLVVRLNRLTSLQSSDEVLTVTLGNESSRNVLLQGHLTQRASSRGGGQIMVDDHTSRPSLSRSSDTTSQGTTNRASEPLRQDNLARDVETLIVGGVAAQGASRAKGELGRNAFLGGGGRVGDAVDVVVLLADLEGNVVDLAKPGGEVLLPGLGAVDVGNVAPDVVDRGCVAGEAEGAVSVALLKGDLIEGLEMAP